MVVWGFGHCRYPRISAEEVETQMDEMAAALEPQLPSTGGTFCFKLP